MLSLYKKHGPLAAVITCVLVVVMLGVLYESYRLTWLHTFRTLQNEARTTAQLRMLVLQSELEKQRAIPLILADDSDVIAAMRQSDARALQQISRKLEKLKNGTHSAVIYMLNAQGIALSASNWALSTSFIGSDYRFREYFQKAMATGYAEQFALGTVSRKPGLYLAQSVLLSGQPIGVVVVKVEFDEMERDWSRSADQTFVSDSQGNIVLTFNPDWRFHRADSPGDNFFATRLSVPVDGWQLQVFTDLQPVKKAARTALAMAVMIEILLVMTVRIWWRRQRRRLERLQAENNYRQQLELDVAARTRELSQTNERLFEEIEERRQAEQRLNLLQADLVQANKLASLGQITAGVAHEINQPLATIRVLADNILTLLTLKPLKNAASVPALVTDNLNGIIRMSERIGHITGELRAFSRKATGETEAIPLGETIDSSVLLNRSRLRENKVTLICDPVSPDLQVIAGRIRLEQVLVNLLQNAFEALEDTPDPCVRIGVVSADNHVIISVIDNGPGLAPDVRSKLFTPFVTTKLKGLGLGLVIAHDIIRDFGGELHADASTRGGSFHIKLHKVKHE